MPTYAATVAAFVGDRGASDRRFLTKHTLYCDETGNSGSRFYTPDQPVFAEGGWLVPHDKRAELETTILEFESRSPFGARSKGTRLKDSPAGRAYLRTVLAAVNRVATPFLYIVEKKYFICAKAVETYFDPNYNPTIDPLETHDPTTRKLRADLLHSAPDEVVAKFADAFRAQDAAGLTAVGLLWARALMERREAGLAMQLRACLPGLTANMSEEFRRLREKNLPRGWDSLNAPSVAQVFQLIERSAPPCDLLHDQCDSLASSYQYFFELYRNAAPDVLTRLDGTPEFFGFQRLNSLSFGNSEMLPLIRACDFLVATCVDFARRALAGEEIPAELHACASFGFARMMANAVGKEPADPKTRAQIGEIMAADTWIAHVAERYAHP